MTWSYSDSHNQVPDPGVERLSDVPQRGQRYRFFAAFYPAEIIGMQISPLGEALLGDA